MCRRVGITILLSLPVIDQLCRRPGVPFGGFCRDGGGRWGLIGAVFHCGDQLPQEVSEHLALLRGEWSQECGLAPVGGGGRGVGGAPPPRGVARPATGPARAAGGARGRPPAAAVGSRGGVPPPRPRRGGGRGRRARGARRGGGGGGGGSLF